MKLFGKRHQPEKKPVYIAIGANIYSAVLRVDKIPEAGDTLEVTEDMIVRGGAYSVRLAGTMTFTSRGEDVPGNEELGEVLPYFNMSVERKPANNLSPEEREQAVADLRKEVTILRSTGPNDIVVTLDIGDQPFDPLMVPYAGKTVNELVKHLTKELGLEFGLGNCRLNGEDVQAISRRVLQRGDLFSATVLFGG